MTNVVAPTIAADAKFITTPIPVYVADVRWDRVGFVWTQSRRSHYAPTMLPALARRNPANFPWRALVDAGPLRDH